MAETLEISPSRLELMGPQQQPIEEKIEIWDSVFGLPPIIEMDETQ